MKLKSPSDLEVVVQKLTNDITLAAKVATPGIPGGNNREITYPFIIRNLAQQKRKARRTWRTEVDIQRIKPIETVLVKYYVTKSMK